MPQSEWHAAAHSDANAADSSVASTPTASRTATPTPVTPDQSSAFEMAGRASGQESSVIVTPRARPRSSTSAASAHSGALRDSDPLAVLVASFPVPPVVKEGVLVRLEQMLRPRNGRHLFNLCPSGLGPPPDCPLPPLPPALGSPDRSSEVEQVKQHTDALGLALTYASPLESTADPGSSDPTSLLTVSFFTFIASNYTSSDALRQSVSSGEPSSRDHYPRFLLHPVRLPRFLCHAFRYPRHQVAVAKVWS